MRQDVLTAVWSPTHGMPGLLQLSHNPDTCKPLRKELLELLFGSKNESIVRRDVGTMHQKQVVCSSLTTKGKENDEGKPL